MPTYKRSITNSAVRATLYASLAVGAYTSAPALAEDDVTDLGKVEVIGSRIKQLDIEGPSPVTVISREDLDLSGYKNVAELLRNTVYNSTGAYRPRSGSSFGANALIDLRGLGADRTAVLIDGKRVPGSPFTGTSAVDLSTLPLVAIERIEILTDSASAIYGADAIGGVINVVLRDDYEGANVTFGSSSPSREGGDEEWASLILGGSAGRGSFVFGIDTYKRDPIFDADRPYSKASFVGDGTEGTGDVTGVSDGGNTAFSTDFGAATAYGTCPTDVYAGIFTNPFGTPGTSCGFAYADISIMTSRLDRTSTFFKGDYEINDNITASLTSRMTRLESLGRFAPAVGFFSVSADSPFQNPFIDPADPNESFFLFHRFVGHGPRDDRAVTTEYDNVLSLDGMWNDMDWSVYARSFTYNSVEYGYNYILQSNLEALVESGDYNVLDPLSQDATHLAAIGASKASLSRDLKNQTDMVGATLTGEAFSLPYGSVGWAAGAEWAREDYKDIYDAMREADNVLGSAGNSASGDRQRRAVFAEALIPVINTLEATAALRWDDYSDFGSEVSPQLALRFQPTDKVMARASWGEGFKAPNLGDLYGSQAKSFEYIIDKTQCNATGVALEDCPENQVESLYGGNPDLQSETSESFNLGIVVEPIDQVTASLDYWQVDIQDAIQVIEFQDLVDLEAGGNPLPPGTALNRAVPGDPSSRLVTIETGFANVARFEAKGVDLKLEYQDSFPIGDVSAELQWSHYLEYNFTSDPTATPKDRVKEDGFPQDRVNLTTRYNRGMHTLNYVVSWIGETENAIETTPGYDSFTRQDLTYSAALPWNGSLDIGVRNIMDEDPPIDPIVGYDSEIVPELYDVDGRVFFLQYSQDF